MDYLVIPTALPNSAHAFRAASEAPGARVKDLNGTADYSNRRARSIEMIDTAIEEAVINAFIRKEKRARWLELHNNPAGRKKLCASLAHFKDFAPGAIARIPPHQQHAPSVHNLLVQLGAPKICYLISENPDWDTRKMDLREALFLTVGHSYGTLISCRPGLLAYFEGEEPGDRMILKKATIPS